MTERFLLWPEVHTLVGLSRTTVWRLARAAQFPQSVALSERTVGWVESEIQAWIAARITARDDQAAAQTSPIRHLKGVR